ncbi:MAG: ATPase, T2SS/T4P/T4SS family, partial [bacterium]|nr:ATPase, T2SS/T4P/T4SS family [bacterium]
TLYSLVNRLNEPCNKIITIEDPIEYHVKNISQTQVEPKKGYNFANGLRSIVRQDPDIILVGEIRDAETAEIALHAALTGHLVLSTIHTNDASGVVPRLVDLGIRPQIIAPAINLTLAQRLVRKLCPDCKKEAKTTPEELKKIKNILEPIKDRFKLPSFNSPIKIHGPDKCNKCNFSGYIDRIGVFEAFIVSKDIERLILTSPAMSAVQEMAVAEGMITMIQDAYLKLLDGTTSIEEIERVL